MRPMSRSAPSTRPSLKVPFFRPEISEAEIDEVVEVLRSGWLTTGPRVRRFEEGMCEALGAAHAVAVSSATAALHLAVEALGLKPGQVVLVPTMTFAATAEVVRYLGGLPLLVDCDPVTLNMDLGDAEQKLLDLREARLGPCWPSHLEVVGMIPVHVGGLMLDVGAVQAFAARHGVWVVEDAAHALPSAWRAAPNAPWQRCGEATAEVTCFSFYANKTITTGEGGMAVTPRQDLAERMRLMSLHGLSADAWNRYAQGGRWDYRIVAPGYKYNLTDLAAAIGIHQLARAEAMRQRRECLVRGYLQGLEGVEEIELPEVPANRIHAWHLFPIRLRLEGLSIDRGQFIEQLAGRGVACSVHWRPLHLHPYYADTFGWQPDQLPTATREWERLVSLPLYPSMTPEELEHVVASVEETCRLHRR